MGFKFCVIGDTCYEYNKNKNDKDFKESKSDQDKRKNIREELDIIEIGPKFIEKYVFSESKIANDNMNYTITSRTNPNLKLQIDNDKQLMEEFWKALSTAHECSIEKKEDDTLLFTVIIKINF